MRKQLLIKAIDFLNKIISYYFQFRSTCFYETNATEKLCQQWLLQLATGKMIFFLKSDIVELLLRAYFSISYKIKVSPGRIFDIYWFKIDNLHFCN